MANSGYVHIPPCHSERSEESFSGQDKAAQKRIFSSFNLLYESRDGKLCVFETREGHITAADASKFA